MKICLLWLAQNDLYNQIARQRFICTDILINALKIFQFRPLYIIKIFKRIPFLDYFSCSFLAAKESITLEAVFNYRFSYITVPRIWNTSNGTLGFLPVLFFQTTFSNQKYSWQQYLQQIFLQLRFNRLENL